MSRTRFSQLEDTAVVFRLVTVKPFIPEGAEFPVGEAFRPSNSDKAEAEKRKRAPLVSVWEHGVTSEEEARAFRPGRETKIYYLRVGDVVAVDRHRISVLADPLDDGRPGAEGHCGIEGLHRPKGEQKTQYRCLLDKIAGCCLQEPPT